MCVFDVVNVVTVCVCLMLSMWRLCLMLSMW